MQQLAHPPPPSLGLVFAGKEVQRQTHVCVTHCPLCSGLCRGIQVGLGVRCREELWPQVWSFSCYDAVDLWSPNPVPAPQLVGLVEHWPLPGCVQELEWRHHLQLCGHSPLVPGSWWRLPSLPCVIWLRGSHRMHSPSRGHDCLLNTPSTGQLPWSRYQFSNGPALQETSSLSGRPSFREPITPLAFTFKC